MWVHIYLNNWKKYKDCEEMLYVIVTLILTIGLWGLETDSKVGI